MTTSAPPEPAAVLALREKLAGLLVRLAPPPRLTVSEWADRYRMVPNTSADPGRWQTSRTPYLREIMDCFSDPAIGFVVFMKCARIGGTEAGINVIGYFIDQDPSPILIVQPTVDDAKDFSKEQLAPSIAETPRLASKVSDPKTRNSGNTVQAKLFPGGTLFLVGANSPRGFRRRTARVIDLEEVDGYPPSAGTEGDQIRLAMNRGITFKRRRKVYMNSTPTDKDASRIEDYFLKSDQRYYFVSCPHCGEQQHLVWENLKYKDLEAPAYACTGCGALISEHHKTRMIAQGQWRPTSEHGKHRGYHINALYSPWMTWTEMVHQWEDAQGDIEKLKTFHNTVLGLTWEDRGGALDPGSLQARCEDYPAQVPRGVKVITVGVDVQGDRLETVFMGWGVQEEAWVIARRVLLGNPAMPQVWTELDGLLATEWTREGGGTMRATCCCVDSGDQTDAVYRYTEPRFNRKVYATKGASQTVPFLVSLRPSKNTKGGARLFLIGTDIAKREIYGRLSIVDSGPRFIHFPADPAAYQDDAADFFTQLVSERRVTEHRGGKRIHRWELPRDMRNEVLDCVLGCLAAVRLSRVQLRDDRPAVPEPEPTVETIQQVPRVNLGIQLALKRAGAMRMGRRR